MHRIYLTVLENNKNAYNLYKKIGFKEDGVLRDAIFKNGKYCNLIMMSILLNDVGNR